jgi:arsenate reductase (thioredoxin)
MFDRTYHVLFLCTGNSARSIMAECALNRHGAGRFEEKSAGSHPKRQVHPMTLRLLRSLKYDITGLRSKGWEVFARPSSPALDFVFTVCDQAAGEVCPIWPGQPMTAHWGVEDPAAFVGDDEATYRRFKRIYLELEARIKIFASCRSRRSTAWYWSGSSTRSTASACGWRARREPPSRVVHMMRLARRIVAEGIGTAPGFIIAHLLGAAAATSLFAWFAHEAPVAERPISGTATAVGGHARAAMKPPGARSRAR